MRKYIALLFCTFIMLSLLSCNESSKAVMDTTSSKSTVLDDSAPKEGQTTEPQETTTDSQETPAPEETEPATLESIYRSVLHGEEQVFIEAIGEHGYLENYIPTGAEISLAKCDILRYTYYDVDADDIKDVAIDCGSEKLYLTYENGTVTLKTLSAEIWEKIEAEDYWYPDILPLAAPWREVLLSREGIGDIASHVWRTADGDGDGACGTYYVCRIVVDDEPYPNGYYLVTKKVEVYRWCNREDCADNNHRHLDEIRDFEYMLVHEKTGESIELKITPQTAYQCVRGYWDIDDGDVEYAAGNACVTRIDIDGKPQYINGEIYYHVVWRIEYYHLDDHTGPYYIDDFKHLYIHAQTGECYDGK